MRPTRLTQPYRKGSARLAGPTLYSMLAGRAKGQMHPMDPFRLAAVRARRRRPQGPYKGAKPGMGRRHPRVKPAYPGFPYGEPKNGPVGSAG